LVLQLDRTVFHGLFTLAMGTSHKLEFTHCNYSSNHPLENQCPIYG